jgi:Protein of unknown function (DUF3891)
MILRSLGQQLDQATKPDDSAWARVEQSQLHVEPPLVLIPQPTHAVLAGELADALLPSAFGELPANIRQAIRMHDTGWGLLDAEQIQRLRNGGAQGKGAPRDQATRPLSFLAVPSAEVLSAWKASIDAMEKIAPECACVVSSHFSLLATSQDRPHSAFRAQEDSRRAGLIKRARLDLANLERWTDALGFCDLLSLYMCSGVVAPAQISRVHPARNSSAPPLQIVSTADTLHLSEPFVTPDSTFQLYGLLHPSPTTSSAAHQLTWSCTNR